MRILQSASPPLKFGAEVAVHTSSGSKDENAVRMSAMDRWRRKKYILEEYPNENDEYSLVVKSVLIYLVSFCFLFAIATMLHPLLTIDKENIADSKISFKWSVCLNLESSLVEFVYEAIMNDRLRLN